MITNKSDSHKGLQSISASCITQIMNIMCFIDNNIYSKIMCFIGNNIYSKIIIANQYLVVMWLRLLGQFKLFFWQKKILHTPKAQNRLQQTKIKNRHKKHRREKKSFIRLFAFCAFAWLHLCAFSVFSVFSAFSAISAFSAYGVCRIFL